MSTADSGTGNQFNESAEHRLPIHVTPVEVIRNKGLNSNNWKSVRALRRMSVVAEYSLSPYGEKFKLDTPVLEIPTIMWHKSNTQKLGTTLTPIGGEQLLAGLDTRYYDLADEQGFVVGKVFPELKVFVIEDQELLFAMSYKSNRNWTLPDFNSSANGIAPPCPVITGGTNVTWTTPYNDTYEAGYGSCTSCIISQHYCHSNLGWTSFPVGDTISLGNIYDAGYRICGCNRANSFPFFYGGGVNICARDYLTDSNLDNDGSGGGPGTKWYADIIGINNCPNGVFFDGCITN